MPSTTFKLPSNVRDAEHLGLCLEFQDVCIRGSNEPFCQVYVTEHGQGISLNDSYTFDNWTDMKTKFPELIDFLHALSNNVNWNAKWRQNDRIFYIQSLSGHEGLYDVKKTVWFDAQDNQL